MFTELFSQRNAVERHSTAPLLEQRLRYLKHCAEQGCARRTLKKIANYQLAIIEVLNLQLGGDVAMDQIQSAADRWISRQPSHPCRTDSQASKVAFTTQATHWLRFLNRLHTPATPAHPYADIVREFATHMREERGLSPLTVYTRSKRVEEFLTRSCADGVGLSGLSIKHIDAAIIQKGTQDGCTRVSVRTYAYVIRAFLRYAEQRGLCKRGISAAILPPRVYSSESLPAGPRWEDVERLCATTDGDRAADIRDHALLLLFAVYGFRVSEVCRLRLEDFNWDEEVIKIARSKQQLRTEIYPLSTTVGEAVLRYLKDVRPCCHYREIFLSLKAPVHPLGSSALWQIVSRRFQPLGITLKHHGPHSLRHAAATRLLAEGLSMKEIGDYLGHRSSAATSVYAKVDLAGLREVADFGLEDLL